MPPKLAIGLTNGRSRAYSEQDGVLTRTYTKQYDIENPLGISWTDFFCTSPFGRVIIWWLLLIVVCACGSALYIAMEYDEVEDQIKERQQYEESVRVLLESYNVTQADTTNIFDQFEEIYSRRAKNPWTFSGGFFFCMSTALTIGWGTYTPQTVVGQWITIPFSLVAMIAFLVLLLEMLEANYLLIAILTKKFPKRGNFMKVLISWGALLIFVGLGLAYLMHHNDWSFREGLYFVWISITTIGYGDLVPNTNPGEEGDTWWTLIIVCCIPFMVADITLIFDAHSKEIQVELREALEQKYSWRKSDDKDNVHKDSMAGVLEMQPQEDGPSFVM